MVTENELDTPLIGGDSAVQTPNGVAPEAAPEQEPAAQPQADVAADTKPDESETDYKAKFEAAEKEITKLNLDRKAENTGRQRTADRDAARDAKLDNLVDTVSAMQDSQSVLIKALNSGDTEGLPAELDTIAQQSRSRTAVSRIRLQAQGLLDALTDVGKDADGAVIVDIQQDERFAPVRDDWNRISGDAELEPSEKLAQLHGVVTRANVTMRGIDRELNVKAVEEARNAGELGRKKALEDANVLDTDSGGRAGAADGSVQELIGKFNTGVRVTKDEQTRIDEHLEALDDTPGSALG